MSNKAGRKRWGLNPDGTKTDECLIIEELITKYKTLGVTMILTLAKSHIKSVPSRHVIDRIIKEVRG